jgi:hypothetical protein
MTVKWLILRKFFPVMALHGISYVNSPCDLCVNSCWWLGNTIEISGTAVVWPQLQQMNYNLLLYEYAVQDRVKTYLMSSI